MSTAEAIQALRDHVERSQQIVATALGISLRAYQKYEYGQTPDPKALLRFMAAAYATSRKDLYEVFAEALAEALDPPPGFDVSIEVNLLNADLIDNSLFKMAWANRRIRKGTK